jgi:hypothetical protein
MALGVVGLAMAVFALSGLSTAYAHDPPPIPGPPTQEPTPTQERPPPTNTQQPPPTATEESPPQIVETPIPTNTRVPPTNTPVPPTNTPAPQAVVAGVQALPRTGAGADAGTNWALLLLGTAMFAASAGVAGLAWKTSKSS